MDLLLNVEEDDPPLGWLFYESQSLRAGLIYFVMMSLPNTAEYYF